jgi:hypothetical protein
MRGFKFETNPGSLEDRYACNCRFEDKDIC